MCFVLEMLRIEEVTCRTREKQFVRKLSRPCNRKGSVNFDLCTFDEILYDSITDGE